MCDFDSPTNASLAQHRSRTEIVKEDQEDSKHLRQTRQGNSMTKQASMEIGAGA